VTAKIIDLGLAKGVSEPSSESAISTPGAFAGTPEFASPEQFAGVSLDIRSDLYSLGVTLWEMLVGQVPFRGSPSEVMYGHQQVPLPLEQLKSLPQPVVVLLQVLLEKDPAQRIQGPAQLLNAIPVITTAIDAGRSVTAQNLRSISGQRPAAPRKAEGFPGRIQRLFTSSAARVLAGLMIVLLVAGAVILEMNGFFGNRHKDTQPAMTPAASIKPPENSIAVLPFESLSDNKSDAYFADGVQDEILSKLAKVSQLKVISRTSVMAYRPSSNRDARAIAAALGVAHLVEGTVQRDGNRVRITTELIDAQTDETLWSESYLRDLTDIFAIQSEIALTVASKLTSRLSPEEQKDIGERPTTNLEAYDLYLQAKDLVANWQIALRPDDVPKAIKLLQEAIAKDPKFTMAYCLLARAHDDLYHFRIDKTPERRALADAAVNMALQLERDAPGPHLAAAYHLYSSYRDYERASVQIALAQKTLPNSSEALWLAARIDARQGHLNEAISSLEKAYTLDPRNPEIVRYLNFDYEALHRYEDAEQMGNRLTELKPDAPDSTLVRAGTVWLRTGDATSLRAALDQLPPSKKDHLTVASGRFWLALYARDWAAAKQILGTSPDENLFVGSGVTVPIPRGCGEVWLAGLQGQHPTMESGFAPVRDQLQQWFEQQPDDVELLSALGMVDAFLGRKSEAIQEASHAVELRPISKDAVEGPWILEILAAVYAWTNEPDLAFRELTILIETPPGPYREPFKADPLWDPIRKDPRFDKLVARIPR
jgi:TolB-like protein